MTIMAIMMVVTVGAFLHFGRGAGMRGSVMNVSSALNGARQRAITYRIPTAMNYGNLISAGETNKGYFAITINTNGTDELIGGTNFLAEGIVFARITGTNSLSIRFDIDGSGDWGATPRTITVVERDRPGSVTLSNNISIHPLTGRVKVTDGGVSY